MPGLPFDVLDTELSLQKNYFLEASAGTGKTFTIEHIFVRLLGEGIDLEEIVVVTFTRAAVLELKTRIRENLLRSRQQQALARFDEAHIYTIHSFCFQMLCRHALEIGFVLEQEQGCTPLPILKRIFRDFLSTELTDEELHAKQIEKICKKNIGSGEELLRELLLPPPLDPGKSFQTLTQEIRAELEHLSLDPSLFIPELIHHAPCFGKMCNRKKELKREIRERLEQLSLLWEGEWTSAFDTPLLDMVPSNLLQRKGPYPSFLYPLQHKLIPLLQQLSSRREIISRLRYRFQAFVAKIVEAEDLIFYDSLLHRMREAVHNPVVVEKIRSQYKTVLIDEFQDTDAIQWEIFSTLFLGAVPLYLVGDPKQSIYSFRGADLYTYMVAKKALGEEAYVTLTKNFRSDPLLIESLNILFARVPQLIALPKTGETLAILPIEPALPGVGRGACIFCEAEDENRLFIYITSEIERLHRYQNIPYRSCAVLVKDRYQARRFCGQCPLPLTLQRTSTLLESDALPLLQELLQAIYTPWDRAATIRLLGGAFFQIPVEKLADDFTEWVEKIYQWHVSLVEKGILSFFREMQQHLMFPTEALYLDCLHLVELVAEQTHRVDGYLSFLESLQQEEEESPLIQARLKTEGDAIQVMTLHMSKGLEFEVVFPIGLISSCSIKDPEMISEKMRQLYVGMTRAKQRLYFPSLPSTAPSPSSLFLEQMLQGEELSAFCQDKPSFSYVVCRESLSDLTERVVPDRVEGAPESLKPPFFIPLGIHSFTSLRHPAESDPLEICPISLDAMPGGVETGHLLHRLFETLDFRRSPEVLSAYVEQEMRHTHLEAFVNQISSLVQEVSTYPLLGPAGYFTLGDVDPKQMIREMEFLYPSTTPSGYIKGFIDLFFSHQGSCYLIDWKSNMLPSYTSDMLHRVMHEEDYMLQGEIYVEATRRYLRLFQREKSVAGMFFFFLRGVDSKASRGVYAYPT